VSYGPPDTPVALVPGSEVTLAFAQGQITGKGFCNDFGLDYTGNGQTMIIDPLVTSSAAACASSLMEQDEGYLTALGSATAIARDGRTLTMSYPGGVLRFVVRDVPTPTGN
jgi:heat shock protein HslJ